MMMTEIIEFYKSEIEGSSVESKYLYDALAHPGKLCLRSFAELVEDLTGQPFPEIEKIVMDYYDKLENHIDLTPEIGFQRIHILNASQIVELLSNWMVIKNN